MGAPPLSVGAPKVTVACALPGVADAPVTGPGGSGRGVFACDGLDSGAVPSTSPDGTARTVNLYAVPLVRPVTVPWYGPAAGTLAVNPPGWDVIVYDAIGPGRLLGFVNVTSARWWCGDAMTLKGALGG